MKKNTKTTFKTFAAWDYEWEAAEYNRMSEQGWQLVNAGLFRQKYVYNDRVTYRYQLDYNSQIDDVARYDETFRDAGWERVNSTANGWHIFRKVYDPQLPEQEYRIYTDTQSRAEMLKRLRGAFIAIGGINILNLMNGLRVLEKNLPIGIGVAVIYALLYFLMVRGILSVNRMLSGGSNPRRFPMGLFLTLVTASFVGLLAAAFWVLYAEGSYFVMGFTAGILILLAVVVGTVLAAKKNKFRFR